MSNITSLRTERETVGCGHNKTSVIEPHNMKRIMQPVNGRVRVCICVSVFVQMLPKVSRFTPPTALQCQFALVKKKKKKNMRATDTTTKSRNVYFRETPS